MRGQRPNQCQTYSSKEAAVVLRRLAVVRNHLDASSGGSSLAPGGRPFSQQGAHDLATSDCCGIIAFVGKEKDPAANYLLEGLKILEPRGYDSAGMTTVSAQGGLITTKFASLTTSDAIQRLQQHVGVHEGHRSGIAHTRWATHGARTDVNAHPHHDQRDRIAVVHNGVILNAAQLKQELMEKHGIKFVSETDTEVISQLIGLYVSEGHSLLEAVNKTQDRLEGTWGLAIIDRDNPGQIIGAKKGSPLLVGIGDGKMFIASESSAFSKYTKEFVDLEDGEVAVITADSHSLDRSRIKRAHQEQIELSPAPWPHWTIKEIMEQPAAIARALNYGGRILDESSTKLGGLEANKDTLSGIDHLIIAACGTSYFAGMAGAHLMRSLHSFKTVQVMDASEMVEECLPKANSGLLVITQSGETKDVHRALELARSLDIPCLAVVNAVGSLIAREAHCGVYLNAGRENAVASTKAFTSQVTVLALIAVWFAQVRQNGDKQKRKLVVEALHRLATNVGMVLNQGSNHHNNRTTIVNKHDIINNHNAAAISEDIRGVRWQCQQIARSLVESQTNHLFVLGKGAALPIALEGALKIKEISYVHAEGYPGGALKHGPYALIEPGTPIILIVLNDRHAAFMKTVAEEVKSRGARLIIITNAPDLFHQHGEQLVSDEERDLIVIPSNGPLSCLLAVLPLQLLAYEMAVLKGINPDRPRNLAKSVTVD
ncbi:glutamine--fructose-6-phosphate transaminase (isomerizing) [Balamuthia mandrillaris]